MILPLRITVFACLLASAAPLLAQTAAPAGTEPPRAELQALNYYLQQGNTAAGNAELNRLRLKYPQWQPPADLSTLGVTAPAREIDRFYRQIAARDYDGARTTLAEARAAYPDWTPPAGMTALLATSQGQGQLDEALRSGDLRAASEIAGRTPDLMRCDRINNAWQLAEAQAAAGRKSQAFGIYQSIIGTCTTTADLTATLEKADAVATESQLRALFATASGRQPAEAGRYDALLTRLLAGRGQAPTTTASPRGETSAPRARSGAAQQAPQGGGAAPRGVASAKDRGDWAGCLAASAGSTSAAVQYQRGWCAYNLERPLEAVDSFRAALAGRLNAGERRDAQYGIALAYLKMGMPEPAAQIAAQVDLTRSQRVDVERQILDQRGVAAYNQRKFTLAIRYFDAMEEISGGIRRDLAMLRAWAYLNTGARTRARAEFLRLHNDLATHETSRGLEAAGD